MRRYIHHNKEINESASKMDKKTLVHRSMASLDEIQTIITVEMALVLTLLFLLA
jgi:hypothetical protein